MVTDAKRFDYEYVVAVQPIGFIYKDDPDQVEEFMTFIPNECREGIILTGLNASNFDEDEDGFSYDEDEAEHDDEDDYDDIDCLCCLK